MSEEYPVLTPMQIEQQLRSLSRQIGQAQVENAEIEMSYSKAKGEYEIAMAKSRLAFANASKPTGKNYTVDERQDEALIANEELFRDLCVQEALVKASRGRINQLSVQTDIARSVSTSVRTSMNLETGRGA